MSSSASGAPTKSSPAGAVRSAFPTFLRALCWRGWRTGAYVILVVLVVGGLVDGIATLHYGGRLRARLAALKSAGKPLAGSDLAPPPVPARENAAPLYLEAAEIIARHSGQGSAPTTMPAGPVPADEVGYGAYNWDDPGNLARLAGFVERDRRALDLVREASSRPAAAFDVDWTDPLTASLAHLAKLRSVARFLAAAAIVASHEGRQTEALERLRMGFVLARRPSAEPSMVAHLVSYAIHAMLTAAAEYVLAHGPLPEAEARRLAEELGRLDYRREFVQAVEGERVFGLALFETMRRRRDSAGLLGNPEASVRVRLLAWGYRFPLRPLLDADELRYLAWMERHARLSALSPTERAAALAHPWTDDARPAPSWAVVTNTANAALARFAARAEFSRTQRQLLQAALGLGIYRQRHESYPGGLEEVRRIGWPVPKDSFSDRDFVYRGRRDGFVLYSVGLNFRDDGGLPMAWQRPPRPGRQSQPDAEGAGDIVWAPPRFAGARRS